MRKHPKYPLRGDEPEVLFNEHKGICHRCKFPIDPIRSAWDVGHIIDRAIGGSDDWSNLAPEHRGCNRGYAAKVGNALAAKIKRIRSRFFGGRTQSAWSKKYQEAKDKGYDPWRR